MSGLELTMSGLELNALLDVLSPFQVALLVGVIDGQASGMVIIQGGDNVFTALECMAQEQKAFQVFLLVTLIYQP